MLRGIYFVFLMLNVGFCLQTKLLYRLYKCFTDLENLSLSDVFFNTTQFTLTMWVRADIYFNDSGLQIFSQISSAGTTINLNSEKITNFYQISYKGNIIGNLEFAVGINENDINARKNSYTNWKHLTISYQANTITFHIDSIFTDTLVSPLDLNNFGINLCKNVVNKGSLFYSDMMLFSLYYGTVPNILNLVYFPRVENAYFSLLSKQNKNRLFYKNLNENEITPKLDILKKLPNNLLQDEQFSYRLKFLKKLFQFKIKNFSLINNSYVITTKVLVINPGNSFERYCLYSRIANNANPLDDAFSYGKIDLILEINNFNFNILLNLNGITVLSFLNKIFYSTTILIIHLFIKNGINLELSPDFTNIVSKVGIAYNDSFNTFYQDTDVDLSDFEYEDKHFFGYSDFINNDFTNLFFLDYMVRLGHFYTLNANLDFSQNCHLSNYPQFSKLLANDTDITNELLVVNSTNVKSSFCGIVLANNCDYPLPSNTNKLSCFSRYLLNNNDEYKTCQNAFSNLNTIFLCKIDALSSINITFNGGNISSASLNDIQTNIFTNGIDIGINFSFFITLEVTAEGMTFQFHKFYLTFIEAYLTINYFQYYFVFLPNSTFTYKIYYEPVSINDYLDLDLYDYCMLNSLYYKNSLIQNKCVNDCTSGYYYDNLNVCIKCESNCVECNETGCLKCSNGFYLYKGICVFTLATCFDFYNNCSVCNAIDNKKCDTCINNYIFIQSKDSCGLLCTINDQNCQSCKVGLEDECEICKNLYTLQNDICVLNCLNIANAATCQILDETKINTCVVGFTVDFVNNLCLETPLVICHETDSFCKICDDVNINQCILCPNEYTIVNFVCEKNCLTGSITLECFEDNIERIKLCQDDYKVDYIHNECVLICPDNCKECIKEGFNVICLTCEENFDLLYANCLPSYCASEFCIDCQINYTLECEQCSVCFSSKIIYCKNIINNCELCIKNENEYQCLKCEKNYFLDNNFCFSTHTTLIENVVEFSSYDNQILEKNCLFNYVSDENFCKKISYFCEIGCYTCFEENHQCLECNNDLNLNEDNNDCLKHPQSLDSLDSKLRNFVEFSLVDCKEFFNNITIFKELNETIYKNEKEFNVKKNTEIENFQINCNLEPETCENLFNIKTKTLQNCQKRDQIINEVIYYEYTNMTYFHNKDLCSQDKIEYICEDNIIQCLNDECTDYNKKSICKKQTNIEVCWGKFSNKEMESLKELNYNESDYCQIGVKYLSPWRKECRNSCQFDIVKTLKKTLKKKDENTRVIFNYTKISNYLPYYIKSKIKKNGEELEIDIDENFREVNLVIKPEFIAKAINCTLYESVIIKIKNDKYFEINPTLEWISSNWNDIMIIFNTTLNIIFPSFFVMEIIEFLQFNEFFTYLYFIELDGGSYFNYFSYSFVSKIDSDLDFIKVKSFYEYQYNLRKFRKLVISSVVNYSICMYIIIIIFLVLLYLCIEPKLIRIMRSMTKKSFSEYEKIKGIKRIFLKIKVIFLTLNYKNIIYKFYSIIWDMNLLKLPAYISIFYWKVRFFKDFYNLVIVFYFTFFLSFFFYNFTYYLEYYKLRSFSISEHLFLIKNRNAMEENFYLLTNSVCYRFFIFLQIFIIIFFCDYPTFVLLSILILRISEFCLNIYFSNKNTKKIILIKIFSLTVFFTWILLCIIQNFFQIGFLNILLNCTYIVSNVFKFIEIIIVIFMVRKLSKSFQSQNTNEVIKSSRIEEEKDEENLKIKKTYKNYSEKKTKERNISSDHYTSKKKESSFKNNSSKKFRAFIK